MPFQQARDDADDVRTSKAVTGQVSIASVGPCRPNVYARCRELDNFAETKSEIHRISLRTLHHGDQRRRKDRRKTRLREIVRSSDNHAPGLISPIEEIVKRSKKLWLGCSQT